MHSEFRVENFGIKIFYFVIDAKLAKLFFDLNRYLD